MEMNVMTTSQEKLEMLKQIGDNFQQVIIKEGLTELVSYTFTSKSENDKIRFKSIGMKITFLPDVMSEVSI